MDNRRRFYRRRVCWKGRIEIGPDAASIECLVRDLSEDGARLAVETVAGLPSEFRLHIETQPVRDCFVKWRKGTKLGIEFLPPEAASLRW